jgi:peptidyl-tRNA hydrolase
MAAIDPDDVIVQYILVRKDLKGSGWTKGAIIAQACHASVAAVWENRTDEITQTYVSALGSMHKVVVGAESEADFLETERRLTEAGVAHHCWLEEPDHVK